MSHETSNFSNSDDHIDSLLKKHVVKASADFTSSTLARIRNKSDLSDAMIDRMLSDYPVTPAPDFTRRTMTRIATRNKIVSFFRPALAAAASMALSISGIWVYETASFGDMNATNVVATSPASEMSEIKELASALSDASPLLDPTALDTLAMVSGE